MTEDDVPGLVERILSMPHRMDCGLLGGYDGGCTCGHDQAVADVEAQAQQIVDLTARAEKLGRDLNVARYGQPDFAWSVHKQAMADLTDERDDWMRACNLSVQEKLAEKARAEKAEAENARLREFVAALEWFSEMSAHNAVKAMKRAAMKGGDNG